MSPANASKWTPFGASILRERVGDSNLKQKSLGLNQHSSCHYTCQHLSLYQELLIYMFQKVKIISSLVWFYIVLTSEITLNYMLSVSWNLKFVFLHGISCRFVYYQYVFDCSPFAEIILLQMMLLKFNHVFTLVDLRLHFQTPLTTINVKTGNRNTVEEVKVARYW